MIPGRDLPGSIIVHPIALSAMVVTWYNDHHCKHLHPGWLTGKLSDVAGLVFFPFWAAGSVELLVLLFGRRWLARTPFMLAVVFVVATLFTAIKTNASASHAYEQFILQVRQGPLNATHRELRVLNHVDPTDLLALPALAVALWIVRRRDARSRVTRQPNLS